MHNVFQCVALQKLRDDMPTLFSGVLSIRCFMWQNNMMLMSRTVHDALGMVRAAAQVMSWTFTQPNWLEWTSSSSSSSSCSSSSLRPALLRACNNWIQLLGGASSMAADVSLGPAYCR